jgi:hypothetical protein
MGLVLPDRTSYRQLILNSPHRIADDSLSLLHPQDLSITQRPKGVGGVSRVVFVVLTNFLPVPNADVKPSSQMASLLDDQVHRGARGALRTASDAMSHLRQSSAPDLSNAHLLARGMRVF